MDVAPQQGMCCGGGRGGGYRRVVKKKKLRCICGEKVGKNINYGGGVSNFNFSGWGWAYVSVGGGYGWADGMVVNYWECIGWGVWRELEWS